MRIVRGVALVLGGMLAALLLAAGAARFADGPWGPLPGGPLEAGPLVREPVPDWGFAADVPTVELQLLEPPRSRTTWILVREGEAFIPCGAPGFRLWKQWPHEALEDGRARVRVEGRRYPVELVRVEDEATRRALRAELARKYGETGDFAEVWYFRLAPREPAPDAGDAGGG